MEKERFLPIGSVVLLDGGTKPVMITSYSIFGNIQNDAGETEKKMYEYGCCVYPEGILDPQKTGGFNHDQIKNILFVGYETDEQKELSKIMDEHYEEIKEKYESGESFE